MFKLKSPFLPAGDQKKAIPKLVNGIGERNQVLLGVTGSGKTFTMANVIVETQKTTLVMAHNKTLAAQLFEEMRDFFPENAVEYFVSYYDYYQPEAYVPGKDIYIAKESMINKEIDRMRHSATRSLLERKDVIIVASVSCIYGIGSMENYAAMIANLNVGQTISLIDLRNNLAELQYQRNDLAFERGNFRIRGNVLDLFPSHYENIGWRFEFDEKNLIAISEIEVETSRKINALTKVNIFANSHYVTPTPTLRQAIFAIEKELTETIKNFREAGKFLEAQRIEERTRNDLEMLRTTGMCPGIENYSRYLTGRPPGSPPPTLFEYLPADSLLIVDESHVTVPQIGAMATGDYARKSNLSNYGFRLPSCLDNRPLNFKEWDQMRPNTIFVSATPGNWEIDQASGVVVEQVIRPTGLLDPPVIIKPVEGQVEDLEQEISLITPKGLRVMVTTLTKKMAERLTEYLKERGKKVCYMHSDIETLERIEIMKKFRSGFFEVLVGINLLREGLDVPECGLVAILDADRQGFLRSATALIQTMGRAARNSEGKVIMYADKITPAMRLAIDENNRRREKQENYNTLNNITPKTVINNKSNSFSGNVAEDKQQNPLSKTIPSPLAIKLLEKQLKKAIKNLEFEEAAKIRDLLKEFKKNI